jgi:tetratricopeptide (TPR) repeat protein
MSSERFRHAIRVAAAAVLALAVAVSASAQTGQVRGKVLDEKGQPVADAIVTFDFKGDMTIKRETKTDRRGTYIQAGLQLGPWEVTAVKDALKQTLKTKVSPGQMSELDFTLTATSGAAGALSADDAKKLAELRKALEDKYVAAVALIEAQKYDEGIAGLTALIAETGGCAICEAKIGDALLRKGDEAGAEAAFKKAIAADPKLGDAYAALASLYNKQQKFDQASEMSKKATELGGAAGAAGGANASVVYNQGIIFWNQSKIPEAKAQFVEAIKLDPNMADAHYWLGMALVNEGALPDAVKSFEKYLSLAPKGQYAEQAQGILKAIKK